MTTQQPTAPISQFDSTFKSNWRQGPPPSCKINPKVLKKLCDTLNEPCKEAADKEVSDLQQGNLSPIEFSQLIQAVRDSHKIYIEVVGSKGEYFASTQPSLLDEDKLPPTVDRITLDSSSSTGLFSRMIRETASELSLISANRPYSTSFPILHCLPKTTVSSR